MKQMLLCLIAALLTCGCGRKDDPKKIVVGATPVPQAEMLEAAKVSLKKRGYTLEIVEILDYNIPNRALEENEVDVNFFQHIPFLDEQIKEFGYKIDCYARIHLEPMAIYSNKVGSLNSLRMGSIVAIPNDPTNEYRALALLEKQGLIQLRTHQNLQATVEDISSNPKKLRFKEVDSAMLTRVLKDVDAAAIPTNFALQMGLNPKHDALIIETADSPYANILAIRIGEEKKPKHQALKEVMISEEMREFILQRYQGAIIPILKDCN